MDVDPILYDMQTYVTPKYVAKYCFYRECRHVVVVLFESLRFCFSANHEGFLNKKQTSVCFYKGKAESNVPVSLGEHVITQLL